MDIATPDINQSLKAQLLIAMPGLAGSDFGHSVIYICEHNPDGAMGLIINQPLELPLENIFRQLNLSCPEKVAAQPLLLGGPVQQQRGFILHRHTDKQWQSTVVIDDEVSLTVSQDILEAMASDDGDGPTDALITLGYAGWSAGQLEQELLDNAWLTAPADTQCLFDTPFSLRASEAAARIGINLDQLSTSVGHA